MKFLKTYESYKKYPKVGDYVLLYCPLCNGADKVFYDFAEQNLGLIIDIYSPEYENILEMAEPIWTKLLRVGGYRVIEYDNLPLKVIYRYQDKVWLHTKGRFANDYHIISYNNKFYKIENVSKIRYFSKDKEKCLALLSAEKYNL